MTEGSIGRQAIVIGAGIAGLTAASVLAAHFGRVTILERDLLPDHPAARPGVPQGRHVHALQGGGLNALEDLFPGFGEALRAAGAVAVRTGLDARIEQPGYDPFPPRDFGLRNYCLSRPLLEHVIRGIVAGRDRIEIRSGSTVRAVVGAGSVTGARVEAAGGSTEVLPADLIVDASGRGAPTLDFLRTNGLEAPAESAIPVDVRYTCAVVSLPEEPRDWKMLLTRPDPRVSGRRAIMLPIEGERRWILGLGGVGGDAAPADRQGFVDYAQSLRTQTAFEALQQAEFHGEIVRFAFPKSFRRHFERCRQMPRGLLPMGDAICRMNPSFGQGMTVAAKEAILLREVLAEVSGEADPLGALPAAFFRRIDAVLADPWATAEQDYVYPHLDALRPAGFDDRLKLLAAVTRLAAADADVHRVMAEVVGMIRPASAFREPAIAAKIMRELQAG